MDDIVTEDEGEEAKITESVDSIDEDRERDIGRVVNGDKMTQLRGCNDGEKQWALSRNSTTQD